jgi:subtilase family serine protease
VASAATVPALAADRVLGAAPLSARTNFFVKLPLRNEAELRALIAVQSNPHSPMYQHFLTPAQFAARYGADSATKSRVAATLRAEGFAIDRVAAQGFMVHGTAASAAKAFGVRMISLRADTGTVRAATKDAVRLPAELARDSAYIIGLNAGHPRHVDSRAIPANRYGPTGGYWFTDLKEAYSAPSFEAINGTGVNIGILMSSDVLDPDTVLAFNHENFSSISSDPVPTTFHNYVLGGAPFNDYAGAEVSIDVQYSLGSASAATDQLYDIPDLSDASIFAGYVTIVEDNVADVISSSFGGCELDYTAAYNGGVDYTGVLAAENGLFEQGNSQGQTFFASSGDSSGLACPTANYFSGQNGTFIPSVESPADSPYVTAVGGTNLFTTSSPVSLTSKYVSESEYGNPEIPYDPYGLGATVSGGYWGSGSGTSVLFARPDYQTKYGLKNSGRSVPDISAQMGGCPFGISEPTCPLNDVSYGFAYVDGELGGFIGTSLSSPEMAGYAALAIQRNGGHRLGNLNELLYQITPAINSRVHVLHTNIAGYNGVVTVAPGGTGYSQITGLGTPIVNRLIDAIGTVAGDPQTGSNP